MKLTRWFTERATWTTAYVNGLEDSAFLFVESGGEKDDDGKTTPRSLRHLPVYDANGKLDKAHLDNAASRLGQDNTGSGWLTDSLKETLQAKVKKLQGSLEKDAGGPSVQDALTAYQAKLVELGYDDPADWLSISALGDDDGDTDGEGVLLYGIYDDRGNWYVLEPARGQAEVIAYLLNQGEFYCREDVAVAVAASEFPTSKDDGDRLMRSFLAKRARIARSAYQLVKSEDAQRYTLGVAYPHSEVDTHGDFTDETEVEQAAWNFMAKSRLAGTDHAEGTEGAGCVVESYIYRGPDWAGEEGETVAKSGDWMLGVVWDEPTWGRITKGELTGFSIQGWSAKLDVELPE